MGSYIVGDSESSLTYPFHSIIFNVYSAGNLPAHHPSERHALDLAGSREQRGSAFELYRKPQIGGAAHHHNMR